MIPRDHLVHLVITVISLTCTTSSEEYEREEIIGKVFIKVHNQTTDSDGEDAMDNDPYEDKDLSSTRLPPLRKPYEREGPSVVNRSSTGVLLIDGNHKVGTCSPVYTISIGSCLDTCHTDRNCPGKWKCCSNGCGRICSPPVQEFEWYDWGNWGSCSASCGTGIRVRNRNCNYPGRMSEQEKYCHGPHYELETCNSDPCEHHTSEWMEWTAWNKCSAKCGGGVRSRYRYRICGEEDSEDQMFCDDYQLDLKECNYHSCSDVVYSHWSDWTACSASCGIGLSSRFRSCPFCPFTGYVGECSGPNYDYKVCSGLACPDGKRRRWSDWSRCTKDCDNGLKLAVRTNSHCSEDACDSHEFRSEMCNSHRCPAINGGYGDWTDWSECSADGCEEGVQYAYRDCVHPTPWNNGKFCTEKPFELRVCNLCKMVDGEWSEWEPSTKCSASCGGGLKYKRRRCDNPAPLYGGKYCVGSHFRLESCNTDSCEVREGYEWGCWSPCSRICGGGGRVRYAICNARDQDQYEELCNEEPYEDEECNSHSCPDHDQEMEIRLSAWTPWSSCSHTCGVGTRVRYKYSDCGATDNSLDVPDICKGHDFEVEKCELGPCPRKALAWKPWSGWSPCSAVCGGGVTMRFRECASHGVDQHLVCPGLSSEVQSCHTHPCDHYRQDHASWTEWSVPTPCSGQCGPGHRGNSVRYFSCGLASDANDCPRVEIRQTACDYENCYTAIKFVYLPWSRWSPCTKECGIGYTYRNRTFGDDMPVNGDFCQRPSFEVTTCNRHSCDLDGGWSPWSSWSACTAPCNGGLRGRRRSCAHPNPQGKGVPCAGDHFVSEQCNLQACESPVGTVYESAIPSPQQHQSQPYASTNSTAGIYGVPRWNKPGPSLVLPRPPQVPQYPEQYANRSAKINPGNFSQSVIGQPYFSPAGNAYHSGYTLFHHAPTVQTEPYPQPIMRTEAYPQPSVPIGPYPQSRVRIEPYPQLSATTPSGWSGPPSSTTAYGGWATTTPSTFKGWSDPPLTAVPHLGGSSGSEVVLKPGYSVGIHDSPVRSPQHHQLQPYGCTNSSGRIYGPLPLNRIEPPPFHLSPQFQQYPGQFANRSGPVYSAGANRSVNAWPYPWPMNHSYYSGSAPSHQSPAIRIESYPHPSLLYPQNIVRIEPHPRLSTTTPSGWSGPPSLTTTYGGWATTTPSTFKGWSDPPLTAAPHLGGSSGSEVVLKPGYSVGIHDSPVRSPQHHQLQPYGCTNSSGRIYGPLPLNRIEPPPFHLSPQFQQYPGQFANRSGPVYSAGANRSVNAWPYPWPMNHSYYSGSAPSHQSPAIRIESYPHPSLLYPQNIVRIEPYPQLSTTTPSGWSGRPSFTYGGWATAPYYGGRSGAGSVMERGYPVGAMYESPIRSPQLHQLRPYGYTNSTGRISYGAHASGKHQPPVPLLPPQFRQYPGQFVNRSAPIYPVGGNRSAIARPYPLPVNH